MINRKELIFLGLCTYGIATVLMLILNYVWYIYIPNFEDWEFFSYNFYATFFMYGICTVLFLLFASIVSLEKIRSYLVILFLLICFELSAFFVVDGSFTATFFTVMINEGEYIYVAYPICILIGYCISAIIFRKNFLSFVKANNK